MSFKMLLALVALAGAIVLMRKSQIRPWAIAAALAAGLEIALLMRVLRFQIPGVSLDIVLGAILTVVGSFVFYKLNDRLGVASATAIALVGVIQLLLGFGIV